jgi:hypothetical protein
LDQHADNSDAIDLPTIPRVVSNGAATDLLGEPGNNNNFGDEDEDPKSNFDDGAFF